MGHERNSQPTGQVTTRVNYPDDGGNQSWDLDRLRLTPESLSKYGPR